jgi:CO dehydrogenase maturation factor
MKIAFAGKGGVGKTTLCAWTADYLARQGHTVWMVDADTALSLGQACGVAPAAQAEPLAARADLIRQRIGAGGMISLSPAVDDLPELLGVEVPGPGPGRKRLLVMGTVAGAGGGCACEANALLKSLLAHLVLDRDDWVLVDLEAGVEHLGRGTVAHVDGLVVVSEPSHRSLETAARVAAMGTDLGLRNQVLALNRAPEAVLPPIPGLPGCILRLPPLPGLAARQLQDPNVLNLPEAATVDGFVAEMLKALEQGRRQTRLRQPRRPAPRV